MHLFNQLFYKKLIKYIYIAIHHIILLIFMLYKNSRKRQRINKKKKYSIDRLIDILFKNNYMIFRNVVTEYIILKKRYSSLIEIISRKINICKIFKDIRKVLKNNEFNILNENKITDDVNNKILLEIQDKNKIIIKLIIYPYNKINDTEIIDIHKLYMKNYDNYLTSSNNNVIDIINNVNNKRFNILIEEIKKPVVPRMNDIISNSDKLLYFVCVMRDISLMLNNGYKLNSNQQLENILKPCLIKKMNNNQLNCNICYNKMEKYECELFCCKKEICFTCLINDINARYNNSEIMCPYCRGDLFGWDTINKQDTVSVHNDLYNLDHYFENDTVNYQSLLETVLRHHVNTQDDNLGSLSIINNYSDDFLHTVPVESTLEEVEEMFDNLY